MTPFEIDTGTTAWVLASAALVLLMTPGLALFYGGMVRAKSVLNMMMMSFGALALIASSGCSTATRSPSERRRRRPARQPRSSTSGCKASSGPRDSTEGFAATPPGFTIPVAGVRRLPGRVRDHHRRPDLGCDRRPREVRPWMVFAGHLGHRRLLPGRPLGLRLRGAAVSEGWLDRQQAAGDRLRRWHRGAHQRRCGRPGPRARARQARRLEARPDAPAQPAAGHARRRPAVVRLVRLQRRLGARRQRHRPPRSG